MWLPALRQIAGLAGLLHHFTEPALGAQRH
jgi:hypothetical protein